VLKGRVVKVGVMGRYSASLQESQPGEAQGSGKLAAPATAAAKDDPAMEKPSAGG
jgi:hypothetical protein